jgi:tetratricopeptide (TPR) repeat protein
MERAVVAFMHRGMTDKATETAINYAETGRPRGALLVADVFAWSGHWAALQIWAERAFETASDDFDRARAAEHIVLAVQHTIGPADALAKSDSLRSNFPPSVGFEARAAEAARRTGDKHALEAARARLDAFDPGSLNPLERFDLANAYADQGEWEQAAHLLDGLYSLDHPSEPLRQRLLYLYRADLRAKARTLYESLQGDALKSRSILRLGAAIYERAGMLPHALAALNTALDLDKDDLGSRLDWLRLCIRSNDEKKASKWIKKAAPDFNADPDDLMELAQLFDRYGRRPEALALAYKTLRRHWGQSERLHLMYMSLFLTRPRMDSFLVSKTVAEDTVVFLENGLGGTARYRIEAGVDPALDVLPPDRPFAQRLMGRAAGDLVVTDKGIGQPETWKIVQIKHKFLDLFHDTLESHATLFPGSRAIGRYNIEPNKEDGFEPLFEQVRARARVAEQAADLYKNKLIPLDTFGKILGLDAIDASRGLRFRSNLTLDACIGSAPERDQAMIQLAGVKSVIVDPATIAIWQEIGLLAELDSIPGFGVYVVQATIDLLNRRVDDARSAVKQKGGVLEARGDKIAMIEPSKEEREARVEYTAALRDWCLEKAKVLPTEPLEGMEEATAIFSRATIDTLGTLVETRLPAIIDDRRLRVFAAQLGAIQLGWTQALLMCWLNERKLSRARYARLVAKLKATRVGFVSVAGEDLLSALDSVDQEEFKELVSALTIQTVEVHSLVRVVSDFIVALWADPKYKDRRDRLSSLLFEILLSRHDWLDVIHAIIVLVYKGVNRFPFAGNLWLDYVKRFAVGHFILADLL